MARFTSSVPVKLPPPRALALWLDTRRWATWVDGFGTIVEQSRGEWPAEGVHLVWQSRPGGRGRVTETVREYVPAGKHSVDVFDDRLNGRQTVTFAPAKGGGSEMTYSLDYALNESGPLRWIFARRELMMSMDGMLRRFATEAAEDLTHDT